MSLRRFILFGFLLGLVFLVSSFSPPVQAAGMLVVTDISDVNGTCPATVGRPCTLRAAINAANANRGDDTITFRLSGVIGLTKALPNLTTNMTIDGTGQNITVNGGGASGFQVPNSGTAVTFIHLTIKNTDCHNDGGGGITNFGTVTVKDVTFDSNGDDDCFGSGIQNNKTLMVANSTFTKNQGFYGAGIYSLNDSTLTVTNSVFSNNLYGTGTGIYVDENATAKINSSTFSGNTTSDTAYGGGIRNSGGTLSVTNSTFSNNSATYGGGIYNDSGTVNIKNSTFVGNIGTTGGGGIYVVAGTVTVTNSTLTKNTAKSLGDGGAIYNTGSLYVVNSTIYGNTAAGFSSYAGGIYSNGSGITLRNTIVATNSGFQCHIDDSSVSIDGYNLADDDKCGNATQKTGTELAVGSLQDNGGPTKTRALLPGSAAIGAGDANVCALPVGAPNYGAGGNDQRGVARPIGWGCDVGAYQSNLVVNDSADTNDNSCDAPGQGTGNCTLREALKAANSDSAGHTITFNIPNSKSGCGATNACSITLGKSLPAITSNVLIDGAAFNGHITLVAASGKPIVTVTGQTLQLNALGLVSGGCNCVQENLHTIVNHATLNVTNSTFSTNPAASSPSYSVGIGNYGTTTVTNSTFVGYGGGPGRYFAGIESFSGTVNVTNTTMSIDYFGVQLDANSTSATLRNTVIFGGRHADCDAGDGSLTADSHNIDGDGSCANATKRTAAAIALGPLQDNGGPTRTMKPGASSVTLNAGDNTVCNNLPGAPDYGADAQDQRGVARPQGSVCDVGAVEVKVQ